jgi:hypothetical protein
MATILIETDLDVISKQRQLVEEALGPDSVYIRMKETLILVILVMPQYLIPITILVQLLLNLECEY